jgi:hypothetical protein
MKSYTTLILLGVLNVLHASTHIFQLIQSVLLMSYSLSGHEETRFHRFMENPWVGVFWGFIGILTVIIGIRDYRHHKKHKD